jgi:hypothetical protein
MANIAHATRERAMPATYQDRATRLTEELLVALLPSGATLLE